MVAPSVSTPLSHGHQLREESSRRERVIRQTLATVLSESQMVRAILLCEKEFPPEEPFSTSRFCQRLAETMPDVHLSPETRLTLLRALRRNVSEQDINCHTRMIELPAMWQQEPPAEQTVMRPATLEVPAAPCQQSRERRQHPRKLVQLPGHYWAELDDTPTGEILLTDISLGGASFRTLSPHRLKSRESLPLEFKLDDDDATTILQNAQIRWIKGECVGVAWLDRTAVNKVLRTYVSA